MDLIICCIEDSYNQPGYRVYCHLEALLVKACKQESVESDVQFVCDFYKDDFNQSSLCTQLQILGVHFQQQDQCTSNLTIFDVKQYLLSLSLGQLSSLSEVKKVLQLILVMPATNASSERSFSALRRVKSYLRTTMKQDRLNHLMLINTHKEKTDVLCLKSLINDFIINSQH